MKVTSPQINPKTGLTCLTCRLAFIDGEIQRKHYAGEWHLYNVKRKVADLPPVSENDFNTKKAQLSQSSQITEGVSSNKGHFCNDCHKKFQSENAFENHLNSKKHRENVGKYVNDEDSIHDHQVKKINDMDIKKDSTEQMEQCQPIPPNNCMFCPSSFGQLGSTVEHMSIRHGFYIPDYTYVADLAGMLKYIGLKIGVGKTCICCNSNRFRDLDSLQKHMRDKNHCHFQIDGEEGLLEFMDFYDYSEMYGEEDGGDDDDVDASGVGDVTTLYDDGCFLTLPSGAHVGHRSLMRYFKQSLKPINDEENMPVYRNRNDQLKSKMGQIGWMGMSMGINTNLAVRKHAKDVAFMKRTMQKYHLKQGVHNNKSFVTRGRKDQQ